MPHALRPGAAPLPARPAHRVLGAPFRFFFLAGVAQIALASLWWLWVLAARVVPALPPPASPVPDTVVHALLMTCGFAPFFMFGFMFTAGPRWLGVAPAGARRMAAARRSSPRLGALALLPLQVTGSGGAAHRRGRVRRRVAVAAAALRAADPASSAPDKVHATLVAASLAVGASCVAAFAAFGTAAHPWIAAAGVWGFLLPVFVTVCHRMIPFFTSGVRAVRHRVPAVVAARADGRRAARARDDRGRRARRVDVGRRPAGGRRAAAGDAALGLRAEHAQPPARDAAPGLRLVRHRVPACRRQLGADAAPARPAWDSRRCMR